jgi:serine/threonine protein kinase
MTRRNAKRLVAPSQVCVVNDDGSITFRGRQISVPGVCLEEVIGSGANGFVVKGHHRILSVPLAVKFWASLRTRDARDKMAQGIAEVKKLIRAERYRSVVLWRTAGESAGVFYAAMDLFHGQTLESWIKDTHPLGLRRLLAYRLVDEVCGMAYSGLYHGDLHPRNVMIDARVPSLLDGIEPRFGIIDIGSHSNERVQWRPSGRSLQCQVGPGSQPLTWEDKDQPPCRHTRFRACSIPFPHDHRFAPKPPVHFLQARPTAFERSRHRSGRGH